MTYFYGHLFAAEPEIGAMFPAAMDAQRHRLAAALTRVATDNGELVEYLTELGRAHRKFGVREEHFGLFRQSLLATLRRYATPEEEAAVSGAFDRAALVMNRAAADDASRSPAWWIAEVIGHEPRGTDVAVLTIRPDEPYSYLPGQHVSVQTPRWPRLWREYSIANAPRQDGTISLHVRAVQGGLVSNALVHHSRPGDTLLLGGASGQMTADIGSARDVLCLAGGTGLAPLKAVIEAVSRATTPGHRREIVLYCGARTEAGLYDLTELRRMELDYPWLQVLPVTSQETVSGTMRGTIAEIAPEATWAGRDVYVSGPDQMIIATVRALAKLGAPADRLHYDLPHGVTALRAHPAVPLERGMGERHQRRPQRFHLLGHHLDLTLRERGERGVRVRSAQRQEIHQRPRVAGGVHRRVEADRQHRARDLPGHAGLEHLQVGLVGLTAGRLDGLGHQRVLLG